MHYRMPGEYEKHAGTIMIWPVRPGSWAWNGREAKPVFARLIREIAKGERLWLLAYGEGLQEARAEFAGEENITLLDIETDDAWARDMTPTFVLDETGSVHGVDWCFNAWGGSFDGLYQSWERDDRAAAAVCQALGLPRLDAHPFVLEGGSVHCDGEGTLITTEACLLSPGRNPSLGREEIEAELRRFLGIEKVIWLPHGIYQDETNEHVDNVCAFTKPGEVLLAWTDREEDPQYAYSQACLQVLEKERDARGRKLRVRKLPIPDVPQRIRPEELAGFQFEAGEDTREAGERLAASYVNFYIANGAVLLPQFGDPRDADAVRILTDCFPNRRIVPVPARAILTGGGNIHCITQQVPLGAAGMQKQEEMQ